MSHIKPDKRLSNWIDQAIKHYISELSSEPAYLKNYARKYHLLPIYNDWAHSAGLRTDGVIFVFSTDSEIETIEEVQDERLRNLFLYQGTKKYPEIMVLVPARTIGSIICPGCRGKGEMELENVPAGIIICYCGGLGWLPEGSEY